MFANLAGFDEKLWELVRQLGDDPCQRFVRLLLGRVESSMDRPAEWPSALLDCRYFARICGRIGNSRELLYHALDGEVDDGLIAAPPEGAEHLLRLDEARRLADAIEDRTAKAIAKHALRLCIDDAVARNDRPIGQFDAVYLVSMLEKTFSGVQRTIRLILEGEGWRLDWW